MSMGFKNTTRRLDFADLAPARCLEQNRRIKLPLLNVLNVQLWAKC
jgi:hypothetical protein